MSVCLRPGPGTLTACRLCASRRAVAGGRWRHLPPVEMRLLQAATAADRCSPGSLITDFFFPDTAATAMCLAAACASASSPARRLSPSASTALPRRFLHSLLGAAPTRPSPPPPLLRRCFKFYHMAVRMLPTPCPPSFYLRFVSELPWPWNLSRLSRTGTC
jgi:hypothetical protein